MRLADVLLSHYGKIPQVPVSYPILLRRALLITQLPKVSLCQMNHNASVLFRISALDERDGKLAA